MITHVVLVRTKEGADQAAVQRLVTDAKRKLAAIEGVRNLSAGVAFRTNASFNVGLCMYFETEQALQTYRDHPVHVNYVKEVFEPVAADFLSFDFHDAAAYVT